MNFYFRVLDTEFLFCSFYTFYFSAEISFLLLTGNIFPLLSFSIIVAALESLCSVFGILDQFGAHFLNYGSYFLTCSCLVILECIMDIVDVVL